MKIWLFVLLALLPEWGIAQTRLLQDDVGRQVRVPVKPKRVVVTHDPLLGVPIMDFGGVVIGSYGRNSRGKMYSAVDFMETVLGEDHGITPPVGVGPAGQIDLERIQALQPDLIIGTEYNLADADRLQAVAPTYLQNIGTSRNYGFASQASLAKLFGLEAQFNHRLKSYKALLAQAKAMQFSGNTYQVILVSDELGLVGDMSGLIQAMEDMGFIKSNLVISGRAKGVGSNFAVPLNPELFLRLNPDYLIVMSSYSTADRSARATVEKLNRIAPGWQRFLTPYRENRLIFMDSAKVSTPSIASAEHALRALINWKARVSTHSINAQP